MIIEVPGRADQAEAWQLIAHIQRVQKAMPKVVLEGVLRELVEHHLHLGLAPTLVEKEVTKVLRARGIDLRKLELRPLNISAVTSREGLVRQWWEVLVEDLSTADGFGVSLDVVVRAHLAPEVVSHLGSLLILRSTLTAGLQVELSDMFQTLELESLLSQREAWTEALLQRVIEGNFDNMLDQMHREKVGAGHRAGVEALWVTELQVKAREGAFRPQRRRPRYGDPLAHFYFMAHGDPLSQRKPGEKEL